MSPARLAPSGERCVFPLRGTGGAQRVHHCQGGGCGLDQTPEYLARGRAASAEADDDIVLELTPPEWRELKLLADADSFACEPPCIEMCLPMLRAGVAGGSDPCRFVGNF